MSPASWAVVALVVWLAAAVVVALMLGRVVRNRNRQIREDDAEAILTALRMVKGVLSVEPVVGDLGLQMAEERARHEFRRRLAKFYESLDG